MKAQFPDKDFEDYTIADLEQAIKAWRIMWAHVDTVAVN
jgi:hypothetical protein